MASEHLQRQTTGESDRNSPYGKYKCKITNTQAVRGYDENQNQTPEKQQIPHYRMKGFANLHNPLTDDDFSGNFCFYVTVQIHFTLLFT